ncbi:hypothetical protein Gpo141_00004961 [Globisporangium polare]
MTTCGSLHRLALWPLLVIALALFITASQAVQFASLIPQCVASCDPPKRCSFVSGKLVCRDGCWENRCAPTQRCVRDQQCMDPGTVCSRAVRCVDPSEDDDGTRLQGTSSRHRQCSSKGDDAACDAFQRCVPTFPGFMCADICDPKRCPLGFSCQLEPSADCTAEPCLPVAMCIDPDDRVMLY